MTQPAVSQRLAALESELEAQLLDRSGTQVRLTPKGMQLLQVAEQVLDAVQRLKAQAAGDNPARRRIRIGATSTISNAWMPELFTSMAEVFPHMETDLIVDKSPQLRALLIGGELDLALLMGPTHGAGVRNLPLARYGTAWVAAPRLRLPKKMTLERLAGHRIITHARDSATFGSLEELFRNRGHWPVEISTTNSMGALMKVAQSGGAIGAVCTACLGTGLRDGALKMVECDVELPWFEFFASYHLDSVGRVGMMVSEMAQKVCWNAARKTPLVIISK